MHVSRVHVGPGLRSKRSAYVRRGVSHLRRSSRVRITSRRDTRRECVAETSNDLGRFPPGTQVDARIVPSLRRSPFDESGTTFASTRVPCWKTIVSVDQGRSLFRRRILGVYRSTRPSFIASLYTYTCERRARRVELREITASLRFANTNTEYDERAKAPRSREANE